MSLIPDFGSAPRDEEEALFSRDLNGQLVRLDAATEANYNTPASLQIDGRSVRLNLAQPLQDAQGDVVLDLNGRTKLRHTTILDAILRLNAERAEGQPEILITTLCHQPHMTPVAVCRLCMVLVNGRRPRLHPACKQQIKNGMEVFTSNGPEPFGGRVKKAVGTVATLLIADHLNRVQVKADALPSFNELRQLTELGGQGSSRFAGSALVTLERPVKRVPPPRGRRLRDSSSPVFLVDHNACILCDRCIRACDEVVKNAIIGRTGKGFSTGIGFDLNDEMFRSNCVQCGECMVSCPTTAITFKPLKEIASRQGLRLEPIPLEEIKQDPLFAGVLPKFLLWQKTLILRRPVKAGDVLCRQGEPGNCAFIIKRGRLQGKQHDERGKELRTFEVTVEDVIVGEMACLSGGPRNADILALEDGEVWEVRRNVLDRMMRSPAQQAKFRELYRKRALDSVLTRVDLFADLPQEETDFIITFLKPRLEFIRVSPGVIILKQGDLASDGLYLVRLGHVRVEIGRLGEAPTISYRAPDSVIGEMALLAFSSQDATKPPEEMDEELSYALNHAPGGNLAAAWPAGTRTATCSALDRVELVRVDRGDFLQTIQHCPTLRMRLIRIAFERLKGDA